MVKKGIDLADGVYDSVKVVKAANRAEDFAGGLGKITSLSKTSKGFTISNPSDGIKIHKTFMNNGEPLIDYDTLGNVIKKYRVDGIKGNAMFELKPYNPRNLRNGFKQITNYKRVSKKGYEMFVVLY